ncbi:hypothetical protein [Roseomonas chloroacetimidivorans]|uniref:hypothetical protein n=1 Tax=Roseomonas chloroacetimidivorans TaxID=1766656 RepID=UPI003C7315FE
MTQMVGSFAKLGLVASVAMIGASDLAPPARAQAPTERIVQLCTVEVTGANGRNQEAEQVATMLRARGCRAGDQMRLINTQPLRDVSNGGLWGGGNYYSTLLCQPPPRETDGPHNGI